MGLVEVGRSSLCALAGIFATICQARKKCAEGLRAFYPSAFPAGIVVQLWWVDIDSTHGIGQGELTLSAGFCKKTILTNKNIILHQTKIAVIQVTLRGLPQPARHHPRPLPFASPFSAARQSIMRRCNGCSKRENEGRRGGGGGGQKKRKYGSNFAGGAVINEPNSHQRHPTREESSRLV